MVSMTQSDASSESIIDVQALETSDEPQPPARWRHDDEDAGEGMFSGGRWILATGVATALLWAGGAGAFLFGYLGADTLGRLSPMEIGALGFVVAGPALLLLVLGGAAREMVRFGATARALESAARRLSAPVEIAEGETRALADAVSEQIDRLSKTAEGALARLGAMEEVLRHHSSAVSTASGDTRREVDTLIEDLRRERSAITELSSGLSEETRNITSLIDQQAELVRSAVESATSQTTQGRDLLAESVERLATAAASAQQSGERAAFSISEQMRDMEALVTALDERASRLEAVASGHEDNLKRAQNTAHELSLAADAGAGSMRAAVDAAIEQARRLSTVIAEETRKAGEIGAQEVERVRRAAQAANESAESASRALERSADSVLQRVEKANEANFAAAARTDEALDERIRTVERVMQDVDRRLSDIPRRAESQARRVRDSLPEDDFDYPEETRAGHADRGRDEFDDDIDRLGRMAERREPERGAGRRANERAAGGWGTRRRRERADPLDDFDDDGDVVSRIVPDRGGASIEANGADMHRRAPAPARGGRNGSAEHRADGEDEDWRWKDVLNGIDDEPEERADSSQAVIAGLRRAGVDPNRAIDRDMTARIARVRRRAGSGEARALVLDGALTDVRRTAAALASDEVLRAHSEDFLDDHARLVRRALDENDAGLLAELLDSDTGRAFLLVDAALSDG